MWDKNLLIVRFMGNVMKYLGKTPKYVPAALLAASTVVI